MLEFTDKNFIKMKTESEERYKSLGEVFCPYLQGNVVFNAKGIEHLKFKARNHARSRDDQYMRLKWLHLAPEVLLLSKTVQGISERKIFELQRSNKRTESVLVEAIYYEFIAVLKEVRVRIIVKSVGTAPKHFWSIIPHWKVDSVTKKRKIHNGNPETD